MSCHPARPRTTTLLALAALGALAVVARAPSGCSHAVVESQPAPEASGVGDPCIPPDEAAPVFGGFSVAEEHIVAADFAACHTGICLVNHFQGRVSCPEGQSPSQIKSCNGTSDTATCNAALGEHCVASQVFAPSCAASTCPAGTTCDKNRQICACATDMTINGVAFFCGSDATLRSYVCHSPGNCQSNAPDAVNAGKQCCEPGTDTPVSVPVCGQCDAASNRNADQAVYCSCRCCAPCCSDPNRDPSVPCSTDAQNCGSACDPKFNYCTCPNGFTCSEIRPYFGLGDASLAGAYCIKAGTDYTSPNTCGNVVGNADPATCQGIGQGP